MAMLESEYADRLDLIAYRHYGALTEVRTDALFRANPDLPLAMREGETVDVPDNPQTLPYGSRFAAWDYDALVAIIEG